MSSENTRADRNSKNLKKALQELGVNVTLTQARKALAKIAGFKSFDAALGIAAASRTDECFIVRDERDPFTTNYIRLNCGTDHTFIKNCIASATIDHRERIEDFEKGAEGLPDGDPPPTDYPYSLILKLRIAPINSSFGNEIFDQVDLSYDTQGFAEYLSCYVGHTDDIRGLDVYMPIPTYLTEPEGLTQMILWTARVHYEMMVDTLKDYNKLPDFVPANKWRNSMIGEEDDWDENVFGKPPVDAPWWKERV